MQGVLKNGDWIMVGDRPEQVNVHSGVIETSTIELGFGSANWIASLTTTCLI